MSKNLDIIAELRAHIARKYRTQAAAAVAYGLTQPVISQIFTGKREPTDAMLKDAGFKAIRQAAPPVEYVRLTDRRKA